MKSSERLYLKTVFGFDRYSERVTSHRYAVTGGNLICILDYHDNLKCQFQFVHSLSALFRCGANDSLTTAVSSLRKKDACGFSVEEYSPQSTQRSYAATKIETDIPPRSDSLAKARLQDMKIQIGVMLAWMAGTQVRKDAFGDIHVNLDSSTPCWNDEAEGFCLK